MPKYAVHAAHRDSGVETVLSVDAPTADHASKYANEMGFLVARVEAAVTVAEVPQASPGGMDISEAILRAGPNEAILPFPLAASLEKVADAIGRLGAVTVVSRSAQYVEGRISFGLQSVRVRASVVAEGPGHCRVVVQASSDDVWGAGAKSATGRLLSMLRNLENPGYSPDRLGISPMALVGLVIGFLILLMILIPYITRAMNV